MIRAVRRRLAGKLFLSYLIIIVVGVVVLATAAELAIPASFERHMASMGGRMAQMMGGAGPDAEVDLFASYRAAVNQSLLVAASAAMLAAVLVSVLVSRGVVRPVRRMMTASQRIADGHYGERVQVRGSPAPEEMDELDQLAVAFNQMAARLERTETMRRQLIGDVAHELRTPLSTLKGSLEGLMDGLLVPDQANLMRLHRETERLQRLVSDLQELSRVEAGAFELRLQPVSVEGLIAQAMERLQRQFDDKGVRLVVDLAPGLPPARADPDRIGQVLMNLLGNALQYTPPGRTVHMQARRMEAELQLTIEDQGIGLAPEHLSLVFTRFYRVDASRSRAAGGSGIGLTIARHLVEAHGGRIWAESPGPDKGSRFIFTLPLTR